MSVLQDRGRGGIFLCPTEKPKGERDLLLKVKNKKKKSLLICKFFVVQIANNLVICLHIFRLN